MISFGKSLKDARQAKRITLRTLGKYLNLSVGYLSDIEHDRKNPPKLDAVQKIEECLGILDGSLVQLASIIKRKMPKDLSSNIKLKPNLSAALLRSDEDIDTDQVAELMEFVKKLEKKRRK